MSRNDVDPLIALRALGALITYPRAELLAALPEIASVLADSQLVPPAERQRLAALIEEMRGADALDLEGRYVELFDRGRSTSLNLFEHVHGESRDRGAAMVELCGVYARAGYRVAAHELPDYLPVVLEYLSCRSVGEARAMLGDCGHVMRDIGEALLRRGSRYAAVFEALLAVAHEPGLDWSKAGEAPRHEPLDEDWAEKPAFEPVGAGAAGAPATPVRFMPRKALQ